MVKRKLGNTFHPSLSGVVVTDRWISVFLQNNPGLILPQPIKLSHSEDYVKRGSWIDRTVLIRTRAFEETNSIFLFINGHPSHPPCAQGDIRWFSSTTPF